MTTPPLILLAHGSPDPDWRGPLDRVVEAAAAAADAGGPPVSLAFMDFVEPSLAQAVAAYAERGATEITVAAAFLSAGGRHLKRDVPALVEAVARAHPNLAVRLLPGALGDDEEVVQALAAAALRRAGIRPPR